MAHGVFQHRARLETEIKTKTKVRGQQHSTVGTPKGTFFNNYQNLTGRVW